MLSPSPIFLPHATCALANKITTCCICAHCSELQHDTNAPERVHKCEHAPSVTIAPVHINQYPRPCPQRPLNIPQSMTNHFQNGGGHHGRVMTPPSRCPLYCDCMEFHIVHVDEFMSNQLEDFAGTITLSTLHWPIQAFYVTMKTTTLLERFDSLLCYISIR